MALTCAAAPGVGLVDSVVREHLPGGAASAAARWGFLAAPNLSLEDLRAIIHPRVLEWLAEAYVRNGDVMSMLYTCTPALMTNVMREYTSLPPQASDTQLTVQRRYQNVLNDAERQLGYFTFLGRFRRTLLPSAAAAAPPPRCVSAPGVFAPQPLPSMTAPACLDMQLLDPRGPLAFWLCPPDRDVVDLCLVLREPVPPPAPSLSSKLEVRRCMDGLRKFLRKISTSVASRPPRFRMRRAGW